MKKKELINSASIFVIVLFSILLASCGVKLPSPEKNEKNDRQVKVKASRIVQYSAGRIINEWKIEENEAIGRSSYVYVKDGICRFWIGDTVITVSGEFTIVEVR